MKVIQVLFSIFVIFHPFNAVLALSSDVTHVVLLKSERKLQLLHKDKVLKEYEVALGFEPEGAKKQEGDGKTPEGKYTLDYRNPQSSYHKSIHISYPNQQDKEQARKRGLSPGGAVFIHGLRRPFGFLGKLHLLKDWTLGCVAVTNEEIDEIWAIVKNGTSIEIKK